MSSIKIKQLPLTLCLLGLSLPAFADGGICIPSTKGGFNVGFDALYLRPNTDSLAYGIVRVDTGSVLQDTSFNRQNALIDPTYDWGFRAQIGYWFPCSCYDINLAYSHLNTTDHDSARAPEPAEGGASSVIVLPLSNFTSTEFAAASSKAEFNLNVIDLDTGWHTAGNKYDLRLFGGLRYANVNRDIDTVADPLPENVSFELSASQQFKSHFKGIGPRIGAQGRYGQCCGWGLDADVSMALLIGQVDSRYQGNQLFINGLEDLVNTQWTAHEAKNCAIPALEAKLGFDYTYRFGCKRDTLLVFEAGYQASSYLDVINTPNLNDNGDGEFTAATSTTSNVTFNGPYLGVKYYA